MNDKYIKHVFVCTNHREESNTKSCGSIGSPLKIKLKKEIVKRNLTKEIRINASGCLGKCSLGPCFVIYPEARWQFNAKLEDSDKIINELIPK
tara:strand:+ start:503 stop:781 length:279 start_codon:yes stop_codon:yes gene_type:complete